ncbi:MAG TPA: hypothetical protein VN026_07600 [Bacteroidia bacterium]|jgi:hypothetical protein|nr:hypothetical protein [Bacteroidia bacterium]
MITIISAVERKNSKEETFVALILSGDVEMVKSQKGKFYATTRKASVPSTLTLELAKKMIGQRMNGQIVKKPCEPYLYATDKGEEIELDFTYEYIDNPENLTEEVFS